MDAPLWTGANQPEILGFNRATTGLTYVASGDFAAYGSWVEIGVTTDKWEAFEVLMHSASGGVPFRVRIGLGAAGSEVIIADGLRIGNRGYSSTTYFLPIGIPAGTRIAVQTSNGSSGSTVGVDVGLRGYSGHPYGLAPYSQANDINPGSNGAALVAGAGVANTLTSWVELVASTSEDMRLIIPYVETELGNTTQFNFVDLAVGAAGSEQMILEGLFVAKNGFNPYLSPLTMTPIPVSIPAGSRISARSQCDNATVDDVRVSVIGIH